MLFHKYIKDILLFSDIMEEPSLRDSSISTVKSDDVGSNPDEGKPVLESQLSKTEEKPVTYHADFEMPVFNIQVYRCCFQTHIMDLMFHLSISKFCQIRKLLARRKMEYFVTLFCLEISY